MRDYYMSTCLKFGKERATGRPEAMRRVLLTDQVRAVRRALTGEDDRSRTKLDFAFLHKSYEPASTCAGMIEGCIPLDYIGQGRVYNGFPCSECGQTFTAQIGFKEE